MIDSVVEALRAALGADLLSVEGSGDEAFARVAPSRVKEALLLLRDRLGFNMLVDLTACDLLRFPVSHQIGVTDPCQATQGDAWRERDNREGRFELTYRVLSLDTAEGLVRARYALKCRLSEGEAMPQSLKDVWPNADWLEREVWDMFGIPFSDRPGIERLLLYPEFVGHPLRKDYPIKKRQPLLPARERPAEERIAEGELRPKLIP